MTKREQELKELFQDLAPQADDCYELKSYLEGFMNSGEISSDDYDIICRHWNEWLED